MAAAALKVAPKAQHLISISKTLTNPSPSLISRAKSQIRSESDPERLAAVFLSSTSSPLFHGDRSIYKLSVQKLTRSKRPDLIDRILTHSLSDPSLPRSEGFLIRIVSLYSQARMVDHAVAAFNSIPSAGIKHSERTLCALLTVFLRNRLFDRLLESFRTLPQSLNLTPGITAHNIALQGMVEKGDLSAARQLLDEMHQKNLAPDVVSYSVVFNGYLRKGDREGWEWVLKEMGERGVKEDVAVFNCRVAGLVAKGLSFEAEELLDVMKEKKVKPNRSTFNFVIGGFCKEGNVKKAMRVFERMKSEGKGGAGGDESNAAVGPNFETYVMLVRSLVENGEFGKGLEVFKECVERKWSPPFGAVRAMVEGLKKEGRVNEAKDVLKKMKKVVKGDAAEAWKTIEASISF